MKYIEMRSMVVLVVALVCAACSGSDPVAEPVPTPAFAGQPTAVPTLDPGVTPDPTATPVVLTDDQKASTALAEFELDPPAELIAWDILETRVNGDRVTIDVCGWTGEDVFSSVFTNNFVIQVITDGTPVAINNGSGSTGTDCLNTELIDSALAATREHDDYWRAVLEDPTTYEFGEALEFMSPALADSYRTTVEGWVAAGLHWEALSLDAMLPTSSLQPILYRQFVNEEGRPLLQMASCRQMNDDYGLYQNDVLFDDFVGPNALGIHQISRYTYTREDGEWIALGLNSLVWAECLEAGDWSDGINQLDPDPTSWTEAFDA